MRKVMLLICAVVTLLGAGAVDAAVYINRDYYWDDYSKVWRYNIVDRHYGGSAAWNVDSDFGLMGSGAPYILEADVYVDAGGRLEIGPGVVVKIPGGRGVYVAGTLDAQGTVDSHITFTSTSAVPAPGSWEDIVFYGAGASGSVMRYCDVSYGGSGAYRNKFIGYYYCRSNIMVHSSAPTFDHVTSSYSGNYAFQGVGTCQATVTNCTFSRSPYGMVLQDSSYYEPFGGTLPIRGNTFTANTYGTHCSAQASGAFDSTNTVTGNARNVCQVYGSSVQNASTWHRMQGDPVWQIVGDIYCGEGKSLTVAAGNVVKLDAACSIFAWGTLTADGDPNNKIFFTSIKDDSVGGDSNADGSDSAPAKGDWCEILFINGSSNASIMDNCVVTYGGNGRYINVATDYHYQYGNLGFYAASPTVTNTLSSQAGHVGAYLRNGSHPVFTNTAFTDCGSWAIYNDDIASNPVVTACSATGSPRNAIRLPQATMGGDRTWYKSVPYVIEGSLWLAPDASLTIEAGTAVKLSGGGLYFSGNVQAMGTAAEPVYFTSIKDDVYGDTNGDGAASAPAPADWHELSIYDATASASVLDYCVIRYAGSGSYWNPNGYHHSYGNVYVRNSAPTIRNCTLEYSANYGFYGKWECYARIENCNIRNNVTGLVLEDNAYFTPGATPSISGCSFTGNTWGTWISAQQVNELAADNSFVGNTSNTVRVYGSDVQNNATWRHLQGDPTISLHGNILVAADKSLTIEPGNVVKFNSGCSIYAAGRLTAVGNSTAKIYFTSWLDDTMGGDTNADGSATSPAPGSWNSILFTGAQSSLSELRNCEIRYGSTTSYFSAPFIGYITHNGSVLISNSDPVLESVKIDSAGQYGLVMVNTSHPTLNKVDITRSGFYAAYQSIASNAAITQCSASSNAANGIYLQGGTISENRTWYKSIPYVVTSDIYVAGSVQLKLNPGTIVKVHNGVGFYSNGDLQAVGEADDKIFFTSFQDDTIGGDTNGNAGADAPARGNWRELCIYGSTSTPSRLKYCVIRYAGNTRYDSMGFGYHTAYGNLCLQNCAPTIENCEIAESGHSGIYCAGDSAASIASCTIHENTHHGIYIEDAYKTLSDPLAIRLNDIHGNKTPVLTPPTPSLSVAGDNSIHDNTFNWIHVYGGTMNLTGKWNLISGGLCPYYVESYMHVPGSRMLTIEPGVTVKFGGSAYMGVAGILVAEGTDQQRINFTSFKDDTLAGDSNGDGGATLPAPGDYREIALWNEAGLSSLSYCVFRYGGNAYYGSFNFGYHHAEGNVHCQDVTPTFDHCEMAFSGRDGVVCANSDAVFNNCTIASNTRMGIYTYGDSDVTLNSTAISGNPYAATQCNPAEGGSIAVSYSDIRGINYINTLVWEDGWHWVWRWLNTFPAGTGNFSADPLFVNDAAGDFTVKAASPLINAGDPARTDPNGTRLDVGAYPFDGLWNPISIGLAKTSPDGTPVLLAGQVSVGGATELGSMIYIEDENRVSGIRIDSSLASKAGDKINVSGVLGTVNGERAIVNPDVSVIEGDFPQPAPFFMVCRAVGGGTSGHNPGIPGASGLNNTGTLVVVAGTVVDPQQGFFWVNDGSGAGGGKGVKVVSGVPVADGQTVRVQGVSSTELVSGVPTPVIRTRSASDVK